MGDILEFAQEDCFIKSDMKTLSFPAVVAYQKYVLFRFSWMWGDIHHDKLTHSKKHSNKMWEG